MGLRKSFREEDGCVVKDSGRCCGGGGGHSVVAAVADREEELLLFTCRIKGKFVTCFFVFGMGTAFTSERFCAPAQYFSGATYFNLLEKIYQFAICIIFKCKSWKDN